MQLVKIKPQSAVPPIAASFPYYQKKDGSPNEKAHGNHHALGSTFQLTIHLRLADIGIIRKLKKYDT
jgi:hypothetical protein